LQEWDGSVRVSLVKHEVPFGSGVLRSRFFGFAAALGVVGCAPSEEEIQREFEDYVNDANACSVVSECSEVQPGCPLGCGVAVRTDRVASVERKAEELIDEHTAGGNRCIYSCASPGTLACVDGRCGFVAQ
jgi:hypothetical protein